MRHEYTLKRRSGLAREKSRVEAFAGKPAPTVNSRSVRPDQQENSLARLLIASSLVSVAEKSGLMADHSAWLRAFFSSVGTQSAATPPAMVNLLAADLSVARAFVVLNTGM